MNWQDEIISNQSHIKYEVYMCVCIYIIYIYITCIRLVRRKTAIVSLDLAAFKHSFEDSLKYFTKE